MRLFDFRDEIIKLTFHLQPLLRSGQKKSINKSEIECSFYESADDVPDPRDLNSENKNLMIFDDLLLEKQNKCESYYVRGRHSNVDCFYLAQNYFKLPRQTIRENTNFLCLFPKILRILITFTTIMLAVICQKTNLETCVRKHGRNLTVL